MANKPTQNDPHALRPWEFQEFVQYFPDAALQKVKIKRGQFVAVAMMLSRHGTFKTGTTIRPSVATLADESGISEPTVRKVLAYLRDIGVLAVTGTHRNPGGGTPVTVYQLRRNDKVDHVLRIKDRDYGRGKRETAVSGPGENGEPLRGKWETAEGQVENHNRNNKNDKNHSLAEAHSPAPSTLQASPGVGAAMTDPDSSDWIDTFLAEVGSLALDGEL